MAIPPLDGRTSIILLLIKSMFFTLSLSNILLANTDYDHCAGANGLPQIIPLP